MWFYEIYILLSNFSIIIIVILNIKDVFNDLKVLIIVFIFIFYILDILIVLIDFFLF